MLNNSQLAGLVNRTEQKNPKNWRLDGTEKNKTNELRKYRKKFKQYMK